MDYNKCLEENDALKDGLEIEKLLTKQLTAQVDTLRGERVRLEQKDVKSAMADIRKLKAE